MAQMSTLSAEKERVVVKRLPVEKEIKKEVNDAGVPCTCVDDVFGSPDPDCDYCRGSGIIKADMEPETITKTVGEKKVWVTEARITIETASAIYDDPEDGDDIIISDIHAFFEPDEDIKVGDWVFPETKGARYRVTSVQDVRSIDNVIMKDCTLEIDQT